MECLAARRVRSGQPFGPTLGPPNRGMEPTPYREAAQTGALDRLRSRVYLVWPADRAGGPHGRACHSRRQSRLGAHDPLRTTAEPSRLPPRL